MTGGLRHYIDAPLSKVLWCCAVRDSDIIMVGVVGHTDSCILPRGLHSAQETPSKAGVFVDGRRSLHAVCGTEYRGGSMRIYVQLMVIPNLCS